MWKSIGLTWLLLTTCMLVNGQSYRPVTESEFSGIPLIDVLQTFREKYGLVPAYNEEALREVLVSTDVRGMTVEEALEAILADTPFDCKFTAEDRVLIGPEADLWTRITIRGTVLDGESGEPLPFASVICPAVDAGTETDEQGRFSLNLDWLKGPVILQAKYLGFYTQTLEVDGKAPDRPVMFELVPSVQEIAPITVSGNVPTLINNRTDHSLELSVDDLVNSPTAVGLRDPLRTLQLLPGLSANDDLSSGLRIRGSATDENRIILDGISLFNIDHFFGIFSAINPNTLSSVELYKNTYPVRYSGFTGGMVEMKTLGEAGGKWNGVAEVNLLASNLTLQVPLGKRMDLMLAGRTTNQDLGNTSLFGFLDSQSTVPEVGPNFNLDLSRQQIISLNPDFHFYDLNGKWRWSPLPGTNVSAAYFRGYDAYDYNYYQRYISLERGVRIDNTETFFEDAEWLNEGFSFEVGQEWNPNFSTSLQYSRSTFDYEEQLLSSLYWNVRMRNDSIQVQDRNANLLQNEDLSLVNEYQLSKGELLTFGYQYVHNEASLLITVNDFPVLEPMHTGDQHAGFLQYDKETEKWNLSMGIRTTYFSPTNELYFFPKLSLSRKTSEGSFVKAAWGLQHQFARQFTHENRFGRFIDFWMVADGRGFPVSDSHHFMLGWNFKNDWLEFDLEGFYIPTDGVIEHALISPGFGNNRVPSPQRPQFSIYEGSRKSRGVDVLLKKHNGNLNGWIAYTLSKSTDQYDRINRGEPFPSETDRRHQLKLAGQYRLGDWDFGLTYVFASGKPYPNYTNLDPMNANRQGIDLGSLYDRLPNYSRLDIGATYTLDFTSWKGQVGFSVYNLLDNPNVKYLQYIYSIPVSRLPGQNTVNNVVGTELQMLGISPNVMLRAEF